MNAYLTEEERAKFAAVKIGIAGAGGLGSNCAMHLVRAGLRNFTIADFDVVNESNLNRQFFFRRQLGEKKVAALRENLLAIDPEISVNAVDARVDAGNIAALFGDCDLLVEAFDDVESKMVFIAEALKLAKPVVTASGLAGWGNSNAIEVGRLGRVVTVGDGATPVARDCAPQSPRVGIAAAMQANAVVSLILGLPL